MESLVIKETMSSLHIAEVSGKRHTDVLRSIREMEPAWAKINGRKFALVDYTDAKGEKRPCYQLTKTECLYIATKFNDEARAKLVLRWEELERQAQLETKAIPQSYKEALIALVKEIEANEIARQKIQILESETEQQKRAIAHLAPKAEYTDAVLQSTSTYTLTQIAHDLGMRSVHVLTDWLYKAGVLYKQSGQWQPTAKCASLGYFSTRTARYVKSDNTIGTSMSTVITEQGRQYLHQLYRSTTR